MEKELIKFNKKEFSKICGDEFYNVRNELAMIKDDFEFSLQKEGYLTDELIQENYYKCAKIFDHLNKLTKYLTHEL